MERSPLMRRSRQPPWGNAGTQTSGPLSDGEKLTGWLGTIISKAVRALAARLVQRQRIFVTTPWLWLLVLCLFGKYTLLCIY